jgi:2-oxoglutarate ferredoxin oxidoreductase subunit delta
MARTIPIRERGNMAKVIVDSGFCKGCGLCVDACPQDIMVLDREIITQKGYHPAKCIDQDKCTGCISCALMCPDVAITIER